MALRGGVALLAGVVMVVSPIPHQSHLLPVFGAYMLTDGIVELVTAARAVRTHADGPLVCGAAGGHDGDAHC